MDNLQVFSYENNEIRTVVKDGEVWWVLKDVCDVLELSNPSAVSNRLKDCYKQKVDPKQYLGSHSNEPITIINEHGLYKTIMQSRKADAEKFQDWVFEEVLPSIRKHGAYMTPQTIEKALADPDFIIEIATRLKNEQQKNVQLEQKIENDKPMVEFAEAISGSKDAIDMGAYAKIIYTETGIGRNKLFKWLRKNEYLRHNNEPYQEYIDMNIFRTIEQKYTKGNETHIYRKTLITTKGQKYIREKLLKAMY